jgi:capsular polysaccharide export protein
MAEPQHIITFSRYITLLHGLETLFDASEVLKLHVASARYKGSRPAWVVGWGLKPDAAKAQRFAARNQLPYLTLEDGFLRSVGLGVKRSPTYSIVADDIGAHYDATRPSRLENMLNGIAVAPLPGDNPETDPAAMLEDASFLQRARQCIDAIVAARLSKYNLSPEIDLPPSDRPRVLVVDQTAGDFAIRYGLANADSFRRMLAAARAENPDAEILIKTHPDVLTGQKRAHFSPADADARTRLLTDDISPIHLLQQVDKVYVVTSQLGFEALLAGRPVSCFGAPFYAGWGLTDDRCPVARRRQQRSLEQVFAAAYMLYARYIDPDLGTRCEPERVIEHLALQRRWFHANAGDWVCHGFGRWQQRHVRDYLTSPWNRLHFVQRLADGPVDVAKAQPHLLVNGDGDAVPDNNWAMKTGSTVWRTTQGLLSAPTAGSWLTPPLSMLVTLQATASKADAPLPLTEYLSQADFTAEQLERARRLREQWLATCQALDASKASRHRLQIDAGPGQRVILFAGSATSSPQGHDDQDEHLLTTLRRDHPQAYILYSPATTRSNRHSKPPRARTGYDKLIDPHALGEALNLADELHTLHSPVGFDALLHGCRVVTYGQPFYAGWGLTEDRDSRLRRERQVSLDRLAYAVLVEYSRYINDDTGQFTTPEMAITRLALTKRADQSGWQQRLLPSRYRRCLEAYVIGIARRIISTFNHYTGRLYSTDSKPS